MANGFSDFLENKILDHVLRNVAYTPATTIYVSLHTADPTDAGTGAEVTGGSYARQAITFVTAASGATTSAADVTFPQASAAWGTVTHVALWDASTAGNMLFSGALTASKTIGNGDQFKILAGDFDITLD